MLWTAPPPAHECHGYGGRLKLPCSEELPMRLTAGIKVTSYWATADMLAYTRRR